MYKKIAVVVIALLIAGLLAIAVYHYSAATSEEPAPSSTALFAATLPDAQGRQQPLKQWRGKILVVNFWATWCPPCREEMPELSQLQDQYRDRNVVVIGISTENVAQIRDFAKTLQVSYPLLAGDMEAMNLGALLGNDKSVLPYTIVIKPDGSIAKSHFGRINKALLEQTLLPLMSAGQ
ncbi:MAG TPA: TlpA disulfide reductase family protein [Methylophilaceae bacterium]|nr:TlpA disulfide reductase family protein [Methylophilaceae bacterium]